MHRTRATASGPDRRERGPARVLEPLAMARHDPARNAVDAKAPPARIETPRGEWLPGASRHFVKPGYRRSASAAVPRTAAWAAASRAIGTRNGEQET